MNDYRNAVDVAVLLAVVFSMCIAFPVLVWIVALLLLIGLAVHGLARLPGLLGADDEEKR